MEKGEFVMYFMTIENAMIAAYAIAQNGNCCRKKVGCVILTEEYRLLGMGYNYDEKNCESDKCQNKDQSIRNGEGICNAKHAEIMALHEARNEYGTHIAVCTYCPCIPCALALYNKGIREVYYHEPYEQKSLDFMENLGIKVIQLKVGITYYELQT